MPTIVGVRFKYAGKVLYFDPAGSEPVEGDHVVVTTERGEEIGEVVLAPKEVEPSEVPPGLKPVVRVASESDLERAATLAGREPAAMETFRGLIKHYKLDMKPIGVETLFDDSKMVFYFVAEERVDFRDLVRDLAAAFKTRIDMRQVGVRDEARLVGGLGHCGEQLCCVRFGGEFQPVSIRMAKEQDLPLNPLKISGLCGRLMCCLRYEFEAYKDFKGRAPRKNAIIQTPQGLAKVIDMNTPREAIMLQFEDGTRTEVPLSAMDCSCDKGCPCRVKAEAMPQPEEADFEMIVERGETAAKPARQERKPREDRKPREERPAREEKPASGEQPASGERKRRRRGGGGGKAAADGQAAAPAQAKQKPSQPRQKQAPASSSQTPADGQAASPEGTAPAARKRRRRRRPSGSGKAE